MELFLYGKSVVCFHTLFEKTLTLKLNKMVWEPWNRDDSETLMKKNTDLITTSISKKYTILIFKKEATQKEIWMRIS